MRVIGTAGHVDHGKSTLIAALTGTHPDRLKEEQAREMTIELGFGWLTLSNGEEVGIVDVPGHRDFIENMLSGVGGIDAALLVIAADEGVMPQTKEHLAILDLLQIPSGLIVLTKTDLAPDAEWLDLLEVDIRAAVSETALRDAPIVRVSAKTKTGLDTLLATLSKILEEKPERLDLNRPRLPIDRVFSMSGFGTVVTGTLSDGHLTVGDEVEILPSGLKGENQGSANAQEKRGKSGAWFTDSGEHFRHQYRVASAWRSRCPPKSIPGDPQAGCSFSPSQGCVGIGQTWRRSKVFCGRKRNHCHVAPAWNRGTPARQ